MADSTVSAVRRLVRRKTLPAFPETRRMSVLLCTRGVPLILGARRADRSDNASPRRDPLVSSQDELRDTERGRTAVLSHWWTQRTDSPPRQHDGVALRAVRPNHIRLATGQSSHVTTHVSPTEVAQTRSDRLDPPERSSRSVGPACSKQNSHAERSSVMSTVHPGRQERLWNRDRPTIHYMS
jgi:hypothetical protein